MNRLRDLSRSGCSAKLLLAKRGRTTNNCKGQNVDHLFNCRTMLMPTVVNRLTPLSTNFCKNSSRFAFLNQGKKNFQYAKFFSTSTNDSSSGNNLSDSSSTISTMMSDSSAVDSVSNAAAIAEAAPLPDPNFVISGIMQYIDFVHLTADLPYWLAIVAVTVSMRLLILPIALKTIRGSARMATMRPDMQKLQDKMNAQNLQDPKIQGLYQQQMKALFVKHGVNPFWAMFWPFSQFPVFIASFLALRDMPLYYPQLSVGGAFWFVDLSIPDPTMILPVVNSLSFLAMIELGADGLQMEQQQMFKNVMRGLAFAMIPLTMSMPQSVFIYWTTNNFLSLVQTAIIKQPAVKKFLDIPDPPKPEDTPNLKINNPFKALSKELKKQIAKGENARAEIIEGKAVPGPPPSRPTNTTSIGGSGSTATAPTTFSLPPRIGAKNRSK